MVSFSNALRPVLGFSKVLGLYAYGESGRFKKFLRFYSIALINSYFLYRNFYYGKDYIRYVEAFFINWYEAAFQLDQMISSVSVLGPLYFLIWHPDKPLKIHQRLESLAYRLGSDGYSGWATGGFLIGVVGHYLFVCCMSVAAFGGSLEEANEYFIHMWIECTVTTVIASQFSVLLEASLCQFQKLNQLTEGMSDLEMCVEMHDELCTLISEMCEVYSLPAFILAFDIAYLVCYTVDDTWTIARHYTFNYADHLADYYGDALYYGFLALSIGHFSMRATFFWILCHIAYEISYESQIFSDHLCRAMRSWHYPCYNKKLLAYITIRPSVNIRVWDLFPLDNTLLASCITLGLTMFLCQLQLQKYKSDDGEIYGNMP